MLLPRQDAGDRAMYVEEIVIAAMRYVALRYVEGAVPYKSLRIALAIFPVLW